MHSRRAFALLVAAGTVATWQTARAQTDSAHGDSAALAAAAGATSPPSAGLVMPPEVRGYRITDSVSLAAGNASMMYNYLRGKHDNISVIVSPYVNTTPPQTRDDTMAVIANDVDALRQTLYDALRRGDLEAFRALSEGADDLHASGHTVRGYRLVAGVTHIGGVASPAYATPLCPTRDATLRGAMPRMCSNPVVDLAFQSYTYYAVYVVPGHLVRIRADLPQVVAANEDAPNFARKLIAALAAN